MAEDRAAERLSVYSIAWQALRCLVCTASDVYIVNTYTSASMAASCLSAVSCHWRSERKNQLPYPAAIVSHEYTRQPAQHSTSSVHYLLSIVLHKTPTVSISSPDQNHHASSPHVTRSRPLQQRRRRPLQGCWHAARRPPSPSNTT
jgi:hypothetical protein